MGREGFEPSKAEPTDLQSAPFDHSGISPLGESGSQSGTAEALFGFDVSATGRNRNASLS